MVLTTSSMLIPATTTRVRFEMWYSRQTPALGSIDPEARSACSSRVRSIATPVRATSSTRLGSNSPQPSQGSVEPRLEAFIIAGPHRWASLSSRYATRTTSAASAVTIGQCSAATSASSRASRASSSATNTSATIIFSSSIEFCSVQRKVWDTGSLLERPRTDQCGFRKLSVVMCD